MSGVVVVVSFCNPTTRKVGIEDVLRAEEGSGID